MVKLNQRQHITQQGVVKRNPAKFEIICPYCEVPIVGVSKISTRKKCASHFLKHSVVVQELLLIPKGRRTVAESNAIEWAKKRHKEREMSHLYAPEPKMR